MKKIICIAGSALVVIIAVVLIIVFANKNKESSKPTDENTTYVMKATLTDVDGKKLKVRVLEDTDGYKAYTMLNAELTDENLNELKPTELKAKDNVLIYYDTINKISEPLSILKIELDTK